MLCDNVITAVINDPVSMKDNDAECLMGRNEEDVEDKWEQGQNPPKGGELDTHPRCPHC